jgi:putative ABC transport system permease protein
MAAIREALRGLNQNLARREPEAVDELIGRYSYARPRFSVFLMTIFACSGLLLVGTGIYGVMANAVSQQTRDSGIRMALGAEQGQVFRAVLRVAVRLISLGLLGGALGSFLTINWPISLQFFSLTSRKICFHLESISRNV